MNIFKDNPITTAAGVLSTVVAVLGAFWAIDSHYATAADLQDTKQEFSKQISQLRADSLDDKIFELQLRQNKQNGKLSPEDAAMLERYKRKLQDIQNQQQKEVK